MSSITNRFKQKQILTNTIRDHKLESAINDSNLIPTNYLYILFLVIKKSGIALAINLCKCS